MNTVNSNELIVCPQCRGTTLEFPNCHECKGQGWVDDPDGRMVMCPMCKCELCSNCGGIGHVSNVAW